MIRKYTPLTKSMNPLVKEVNVLRLKAWVDGIRLKSNARTYNAFNLELMRVEYCIEEAKQHLDKAYAMYERLANK